jgi:hypothetical protein
VSTYASFLDSKRTRLADLRETEPDRFRSTFIYGLVDPRTDEVRYIGKSDNPRSRLAAHLRDRSDNHRCHWLGELRSADLQPTLLILDEVCAWGWQDVEVSWIAYGRDQGWPLTNGTDGGDGVVGLSASAKARIRAAWLGRKHRPETLLKIGAASRGRRHTPEHRARMSSLMRDRDFTPKHRQRIATSLRKLTDEQVGRIRLALARREKQSDIAACYGVDQGTISNIRLGTSYGDVQSTAVEQGSLFAGEAS